MYPLQSQIICESESITSPVFTLVCDCLADGGEVCYDPGEEQKEIQMGLSAVCEGETTFVKDPSAQVSFGTNSVSEGCSFLNISIIYRVWITLFFFFFQSLLNSFFFLRIGSLPLSLLHPSPSNGKSPSLYFLLLDFFFLSLTLSFPSLFTQGTWSGYQPKGSDCGRGVG